MSLPIARRSAVARRGRLALIATAVALSVALSVAAFEFAALMGQALGTDATSGPVVAADVPEGAVVVTARTSAATTATALDDELIARLEALDGVLVATGTLDQPVSFRLRPQEQPERPVALRGVVFSTAFTAPWEVVSGRAPSGPDEVAVDAGGAVVGQVAVGEVAELELPTGRRDVAVVGVVSRSGDAAAPPDGAASATPALAEAHVVFDPDVIAGLLGAEGRVDRITVLPAPSADRDELAGRIGEELGDGVRVTATSDPAAVAQQTVATLDDGVRRATSAFAAVTALVAVVVVANVYAVVLAPRARELALLRLVGARRAQLVRWLLSEAILVGVVAAAVGFALGVPLGAAAARTVQTGAVEVRATVTASMVAAALVVGVGVSVVGALAPALRASRVPPIRALGDLGDRRGPNRLVATAIGSTVGAVGAALARLVPRPLTPVPRLAAADVRRRPAATAAAAGTLLVGLVLVGAVAVGGASVRAGVAQQFRTTSTADLFVQRRGVVRVDRDSLLAELAGRRIPVAGATEVVSVDGVLVAGGTTESRVVAAQLEAIGSVVELGVTAGAVGGPGDVLLADDVASALGLEVGDAIGLRSVSGAEARLRVGATYANTAFYGPAVVHIDDAAALGAEGTFELLALDLGDGPTRRAEREVERGAARFPRVRVNDPEEFAALNGEVADTVLRIVSILLAGAVAIGAVGLAATLALGVVERSTELSRMRALGATRGQVEALITVEAVLVCVGTAVVGLGIGAALGWFGIALAPDDLVAVRQVPWAVLVRVGVGAVALGALVAVVPARRAAALPPISATRT